MSDGIYLTLFSLSLLALFVVEILHLRSRLARLQSKYDALFLANERRGEMLIDLDAQNTAYHKAYGPIKCADGDRVNDILDATYIA